MVQLVKEPTQRKHDFLSAKHSDTTPAVVQRGDLIIGATATPKWQRLGKGSDGQYLRGDGTDSLWSALHIVDDTNPTLSGDLAMGGFDLAVGDSDLNIEFNSSSNRTLTLTNTGAGSDIFAATSIQATGAFFGPIFANNTPPGNIDINAFAVSGTTITLRNGQPGQVTAVTIEGTLNTDDDLGVTGDIIVSGTVDGRDVLADGTAQDSHIADSANPHGTDIENLGSGTLAELNAAISDATLDDASGSRTPSAHTVASHSDTSATGVELETLTNGSDSDSLHVHSIADAHIADTSGNPHSVDIADVTPLTTKGDVLIRDASATIRLGVGADGEVLTSQADGTVAWEAGGGGGGGDVVDDTTPQLGGNLQSNSFDVEMAAGDKITFRASTQFIESLGLDDLTVEAATDLFLRGLSTTIIGVAGGSIALADNSGVEYDFFPQATGEWNLGKSGNTFGEVWAVSFIPATLPTAWTITNDNTVTTFSANTASEVGDALATLIKQLTVLGLLQ